MRTLNATTDTDTDLGPPAVWEQDTPPHPRLVALPLQATHTFPLRVDYAALVVTELEREQTDVSTAGTVWDSVVDLVTLEEKDAGYEVG